MFKPNASVTFRSSTGAVDKGVGLFALTPLCAGTQVATVAREDLLNTKTAAQLAAADPPLAAALARIDARDERTVLLLALLRLRRASGTKTESRFAEYAAALPGRLATPVFFSRNERALLAGTGVDAATDAKLARLQREFVAASDALEALDARVDLAAWMWADAVFWSRVISFKSAGSTTPDSPDYNLVPLIDFANHSETPEMHWKISDDGSISLVTVSEETIPVGTELHISYGEKPNAELLFIHGFALQNNKNDSISFPAPIVEAYGETEQEFAVFQQKQLLIETAGLPPNVLIRLPPQDGSFESESESNAFDSILSSCSHIISVDSLLTLLVCVSTPSDFEESSLWDCKTKQELTTLFLGHPLLNVMYLRIWTILLNVIEERATALTMSEPSEPDGSTQAVADDDDDDDDDNNSSSFEIDNAQRLHFVNILREGHYEILGNALEVLTRLQAEYAEMQDVVAYLAAMNI
ncbi:hypothetical protein BDR26DRAFT_840623 [Obelidium mucronatum]|nr:hypothetical protein BDR26DRAFT_840623 [Obelidium mucronatum]